MVRTRPRSRRWSRSFRRTLTLSPGRRSSSAGTTRKAPTVAERPHLGAAQRVVPAVDADALAGRPTREIEVSAERVARLVHGPRALFICRPAAASCQVWPLALTLVGSSDRRLGTCSMSLRLQVGPDVFERCVRGAQLPVEVQQFATGIPEKQPPRHVVVEGARD